MSSLTDSTGFSFGLGVAGRLPSLIPWGAVDFLAPSFPARPPSLGFGFSESPSGNACCASGSTALFFAMSCERFMSIRFLFSQSDHPATQGSDASVFERSEEHTSELQSLMRISYAVFCLKNKTKISNTYINTLNKKT